MNTIPLNDRIYSATEPHSGVFLKFETDNDELSEYDVKTGFVDSIVLKAHDLHIKQEVDKIIKTESSEFQVKMEFDGIRWEDTKQHINFEDDSIITKTESSKCQVKTEFDPIGLEDTELHIKFEDDNMVAIGTPIDSDEDSCRNQTGEILKHEGIHRRHESKHAEPSQKPMFKCSECDFVFKCKSNLKKHMLKHADSSQVEMFKCLKSTEPHSGVFSKFETDNDELSEYDVKTGFVDSIILKAHDLHIKQEVDEKFGIGTPIASDEDSCQNQTGEILKHEGIHRRHESKHAKPSQKPMFKCSECNFVFKCKRNLKKHMLKHADSSQVEMFKCLKCNYASKYKNSFKRHCELVHADPSQIKMYKCPKCNYANKDRGVLKKHERIHADPSQIKMFRCLKCNYASKDKSDLKKHESIHADPSQIKMFGCLKCNYTSKDKSNLRKHERIHADPSQIQLFRCLKCNYASKHRSNLKTHELVHADPSQIQMFRCLKCNYASKYKASHKRHVLIHADLNK